MRISTPLTSRARKHKVVIQCVTRTRAECRAVTVLAGTSAAEVAAQAASLIRECYQVARTLRKPRSCQIHIIEKCRDLSPENQAHSKSIGLPWSLALSREVPAVSTGKPLADES